MGGGNVKKNERTNQKKKGKKGSPRTTTTTTSINTNTNKSTTLVSKTLKVIGSEKCAKAGGDSKPFIKLLTSFDPLI